ncbi:MAG TPA: hypothetical protein HA271_08490 [Methanobacterium subterraneum]|uniref:Uncharacterized protein n=1 Tax=Methanobacterium subterraneum TaxID=59277 RepID=A0A7J4TKL4_9EURY|nr:hypothetical protein [Methanobacterium subterraneum]
MISGIVLYHTKEKADCNAGYHQYASFYKKKLVSISAFLLPSSQHSPDPQLKLPCIFQFVPRRECQFCNKFHSIIVTPTHIVTPSAAPENSGTPFI